MQQYMQELHQPEGSPTSHETSLKMVDILQQEIDRTEQQMARCAKELSNMMTLPLYSSTPGTTAGIPARRGNQTWPSDIPSERTRHDRVVDVSHLVHASVHEPIVQDVHAEPPAPERHAETSVRAHTIAPVTHTEPSVHDVYAQPTPPLSRHSDTRPKQRFQDTGFTSSDSGKLDVDFPLDYKSRGHLVQAQQSDRQQLDARRPHYPEDAHVPLPDMRRPQYRGDAHVPDMRKPPQYLEGADMLDARRPQYPDTAYMPHLRNHHVDVSRLDSHRLSSRDNPEPRHSGATARDYTVDTAQVGDHDYTYMPSDRHAYPVQRRETAVTSPVPSSSHQGDSAGLLHRLADLLSNKRENLPKMEPDVFTGDMLKFPVWATKPSWKDTPTHRGRTHRLTVREVVLPQQVHLWSCKRGC